MEAGEEESSGEGGNEMSRVSSGSWEGSRSLEETGVE